MNTAKSVLISIIMIFVAITAVLLLLAIFNVTADEEARRLIVQFAQASGVFAAALIVIFLLSTFGKTKK